MNDRPWIPDGWGAIAWEGGRTEAGDTVERFTLAKGDARARVRVIACVGERPSFRVTSGGETAEVPNPDGIAKFLSKRGAPAE